MNRSELNKRIMGETVLHVLDEDSSTISTVVSLPPVVERLRTTLSQMGDKQGEIIEDRKGVTESKTVTKGELIDDAMEHYGQFYMYADAVNDIELRSFASVSEHELVHEREDNLVTRLNLLLSKFDEVNTEPVKPELANYELSPAVKDEFAQELELFTGKKDEVNTGRTERSSARTSLTELFQELDRILTLLDKGMLKFKRKNPELYQKFLSARVIIDRGGGHGSDAPGTEEPPAVG